MKKDQELNFQIKAIELLSVEINHPKEPLPPQHIFRFDIQTEHKFSIEDHLVNVICSIRILHSNNSKMAGAISCNCIFEIANMQTFITKDKQIDFPEFFVITLNSIAISTVRGIMFSQFKGTFLHDAILPIIDPKSFTSDKK